MIAIETKALTRVYQTYKKPEGLLNSVKGFWNRAYESKIALAPTELKIEQGQIVGLVGANGAGKTTLLKLLSGLIYPTSGNALVLGFKPWERSPQLLKKISILLGQKNQLWWDIPAADSYSLLAKIYDLDEIQARQRSQQLAEILGCQSLLQVQLRRLSLGERMKMEIIGALLHKPEVIFLDEPTIGLDIVAQKNIREFLVQYARDFKPTVILTSHYMDDISKLADRLLLISQGRMVYDGTVNEFMTKSKTKQRLSVTLEAAPQTRVELEGGLFLAPGENFFSADVPAESLGPVMQKILNVSAVRDLKVDEANFEDVIHEFLQAEPGMRQTRRHLSI